MKNPLSKKTTVTFRTITLCFLMYFVFSSFTLNYPSVISTFEPTWTVEKALPNFKQNTSFLAHDFKVKLSEIRHTTTTTHLCRLPLNFALETLVLADPKRNSTGLHLFIGFYYGVSLLGIFSTLFIYKLLQVKKWFLLIIFQLTTLCLFIYNDLCLINKSSDDLWLSVTYNYILITSISIIILLLLKFSTFTVKRLFRDYELKIYLVLSTLSAILYFFTDSAPRYFDGLVLLLLALTYYLLFKQKEGTQYNLSYTLLYLSQWLLYSFCLAPVTKGFYQQFETLDNIYLKLLVMCTTLFILVNNYLKVRNIREDNKTNKVLNAQYIMMLKTYHKQLKEQLQQSNTENLDTKVKELKNDPRSSKEQLQKQYKLTDREMDVLKLLLDGLTNKEISENLKISESTTKYHISNIYTKLEVSSRNQLFALQLLQI